jgi:hypothetical protein
VLLEQLRQGPGETSGSSGSSIRHRSVIDPSSIRDRSVIDP